MDRKGRQASEKRTEEIKASFKAKIIRGSSTDRSERKTAFDSGNQFKEQILALKMEELTAEKKKLPSESSLIIKKRRSSISGLREAAFNELSFKSRFELIPGQEKESSNSTISSRQNIENSLVNLSNEAGKKSSIDLGFSFMQNPGLKRALTPSFTHRTSGFLPEKKNSMTNLGKKQVGAPNSQSQTPFSSGSILPQESKFEKGTGDVTCGFFNPSIDEGSLRLDSERKTPELKGPASFLSQSKNSISGSQTHRDQPGMPQQTQFKLIPVKQSFNIKKSPNSFHEFETVKEQSTQQLTMKDEEEQKEKVENEGQDYKRQSSKPASRQSSTSEKGVSLVTQKDQADQTNQVTVLYSLPIRFREQPSAYSSKTLDAKNSEGNTPVKALPLSRVSFDIAPLINETYSGAAKFSIGKTPRVESALIFKTERSFSASKLNFPTKEVSNDDFAKSSNEKKRRKSFTPITKLTVKEKFKCNLLDIIKNEEDDVSPISLLQKNLISTTPLSFQGAIKCSKIDAFQSSRKMSADTISLGIQMQKTERDKEKNAPIRESTFLSKGTLSSNVELQKSRRDSLQKDLGTTPKKGLEKKNKDLLSFFREESNNTESQPKISLPTLDKRGSVDIVDGRRGSVDIVCGRRGSVDIVGGRRGSVDIVGGRRGSIDSVGIGSAGQSPIVKNSVGTSLRIQIIDTENSQNPIQSGMTPANNYYNLHNQSQFTFTPSHLNETNSRSIFNFEDNVSPMNVSNYVFYCESEEVEYNEESGVSGPFLRKNSKDQRILAGVLNSPSNRSPNHSQIIKPRPLDRAPFSQARISLMSPLNRKDSTNSNTNTNSVDAKKESFTSLSAIRNSGLPAFNWQESNLSNQQPSEPNSEENEHNFGSPVNIAKRLGMKIGDSNRYRPVRASIFHQESGVGDDVAATQQTNEPTGENHPGPSANNDPHMLNPSRKKFARLSSDTYTGSFSPIPRSPILKRTQTNVVETNKLDKTKDDEGQKKINQYLLVKQIGRGGFGKVKLAQDIGTNRYYAIKIANKAKLKRKLISKTKDALNTLASEIAIMKKLDHPNIVRLWEVIDDPQEDKLYLVMDLVKKGAIMSKEYWKYEREQALNRGGISIVNPREASIGDSISGRKALTEEKARKYFRELILGLDYLHNHVGVIHRDIKPENLLVDEFDVLKVSDFGVSSIMEANSDELKNNAGTKLFLPPESFEGKSFRGIPADIWAAGATLFFFLAGKPPFNAAIEPDLVHKVTKEEPEYPGTMNENIKEVIKGCLRKDPEKRITLAEIRASAWLTEDGKYLVENVFEDELEFKPSEQEINAALTSLTYRAFVKIKAKMMRHLDRTRDKIIRRKSSFAVEAGETAEHNNTKLSEGQAAVAKEEEQKKTELEQKKTNQQRLHLLKALH